MTNAEMTAGRYLRWHLARRKVDWIRARLHEGATVQLTTYVRTTRYSRKHVDMFRATRSGAFVQTGKRWVCIDGCKVTAYK